ncbi:MAG: peptide-methionine (R)-S-oxide reductase MsrB [Armatimonadota bacterium]
MNPNLKIAALGAAAGVAVLGALTSLPGREAVATAAVQTTARTNAPLPKPNKNGKVVLSDREWRRLLTPAQYNVLRHEGTEAAYSHPYNSLHDKGTFVCGGCGLPLFTSETKFESGTGWPSFYQPINKTAVKNVVDRSYGMERTEVQCSRCDGHLGHVFDDGPKPTGLRYCMNGLALKFIPTPKPSEAAKAK